MSKEIYLKGIDAEELFNKIEEIFEKLFKAHQSNVSSTPKVGYISRKETASLLKISLPTLNELTKRGKLQSYRIGTRILYKNQEVEQALVKRNFKSLTRT